MTSLQTTLTAQARQTAATVNEALENLPKPVQVVEKAFDITEAFLASARSAAVDAAKRLTPEAPKATKKPAAKKVGAAAE